MYSWRARARLLCAARRVCGLRGASVFVLCAPFFWFMSSFCLPCTYIAILSSCLICLHYLLFGEFYAFLYFHNYYFILLISCICPSILFSNFGFFSLIVSYCNFPHFLLSAIRQDGFFCTFLHFSLFPRLANTLLHSIRLTITEIFTRRVLSGSFLSAHRRSSFPLVILFPSDTFRTYFANIPSSVSF